MELLSHVELPDGAGTRATYGGIATDDIHGFSAAVETLREMAIVHVAGRELDPLAMAGVKGNMEAARHPQHQGEYDPLRRDEGRGMADVGSGILFDSNVHNLSGATYVLQRGFSGGNAAIINIRQDIATVDLVLSQAA